MRFIIGMFINENRNFRIVIVAKCLYPPESRVELFPYLRRYKYEIVNRNSFILVVFLIYV